MTHRAPRLVTASTLLGLALLGCGPSAAVRRAQALYDRGDYAGAAVSADADLARASDDDELWRVRVRAALAQGDAAAIAATYQRYQAARGGADDHALTADLAMATLRQGLGSPSRDARVAAAGVVEDLMIMSLADAVAALMNDSDDRVSAAAAIAVLRGYPGAAYAATDALSSADPVARRIAVTGIGQKVGALAGDDLRKMAGDPDAGVRAAAIAAIAPLDDAASRAAVDHAVTDAAAAVRAAAVAALARRATEVTAAQAQAALADVDVSVRVAGVELAAAHAPDLLPPLLTDAEPTVALAAARVLARGAHRGAPDAAVVATFERAISNPSHAVRAAALSSWEAAFGKPAAAGRARAALTDPAAAVRRAAARLLAYAEPAARADAAEVLHAIAVDPAAGTLAGVAAAELAGLGDARGTTLLGTALTRAAQADERLRLVTLHQTVARQVTPALVAALADVSGEVRVAAAAALLTLARGADA